MAWQFGPADLDRVDVAALIGFHHGEMRRHSPPEACNVLPVNALRDPVITLFDLRDGVGGLLGVGALKRLADDHGELKSMRTQPAALGRGVGGALLDGLVAEARRRGWTRLSLETGSGAEFAAALALYERAGFVATGPFAGYPPSPFTRFLTRAI